MFKVSMSKRLKKRKLEKLKHKKRSWRKIKKLKIIYAPQKLKEEKKKIRPDYSALEKRLHKKEIEFSRVLPGPGDYKYEQFDEVFPSKKNNFTICKAKFKPNESFQDHPSPQSYDLSKIPVFNRTPSYTFFREKVSPVTKLLTPSVFDYQTTRYEDFLRKRKNPGFLWSKPKQKNKSGMIKPSTGLRTSRASKNMILPSLRREESKSFKRRKKKTHVFPGRRSLPHFSPICA